LKYKTAPSFGGFFYGENMPLIIQTEWFTKEQIQANPNVWFVFGDNEDRKGTGGQAKPCRGEPNTIGIRTKRHPNTAPDAYWTDETFEDNIKMIIEDFRVVCEKLAKDETVIFPADGFGTGLANLKTNAPKTLYYIESWITTLKFAYEG